MFLKSVYITLQLRAVAALYPPAQKLRCYYIAVWYESLCGDAPVTCGRK